MDESLTLSLLMKDVEAGHAFVLEGGEEEARRRWGKHVAAGNWASFMRRARKSFALSGMALIVELTRLVASERACSTSWS